MNSLSVCSQRHSWFIPVPRQPNGLLKWQSIFSGALHESSTCWVYLFTGLVLALCCVEMRWWWSSGNGKSLVTSAAFDPQRWELDTFPLRPSAYSFLWLSKKQTGLASLAPTICFLHALFLHKSLDLKHCCNLFVVAAISHTDTHTLTQLNTSKSMQRFLLEAQSCKLYYDNFWVIRAMGLQSLRSLLSYCATILSAIVGIVCTFGALAYHYLVVALEIALSPHLVI